MYMTEEQSERPLKIVRPKLRLYGHDGNIFSIMADASYLLREAGRPEDAKEMQERVHASGDYYTALNIISEYVETELSIDKEKKTGEETGERRNLPMRALKIQIRKDDAYGKYPGT